MPPSIYTAIGFVYTLAHTVGSRIVEVQLGEISNSCLDPRRQMPALLYSVSMLTQTPRKNEYLISPANFTNKSELLDVCATACIPNCCMSYECKKQVNSNGMLLVNEFNYLVVFGGIEVSLTAPGSLDCYFQTDASECLGLAVNDAYMVGQDGSVYEIIIPSGAVKPPRLFGHNGALIFVGSTMYMYIYGGRTPDTSKKINSELWRLAIPYTPIARNPSGNTWEKITLTGESIPGLFGHSMISVDNKLIYIFAGADENMNTYNSLYEIDTGTNIARKISWTPENITYNVKARYFNTGMGWQHYDNDDAGLLA